MGRRRRRRPHRMDRTVTPARLWRRATAEFLGTGLLVVIVVGSGIAENGAESP